MSKVQDAELLSAFDRLCAAFGVVSAGFDRKKITAPVDGSKHDGQTRWAIHYDKKSGYMIVNGCGGCGVTFSRWNGYIKGRWNFLMYLEGLVVATNKFKRMKGENDSKQSG